MSRSLPAGRWWEGRNPFLRGGGRGESGIVSARLKVGRDQGQVGRTNRAVRRAVNSAIRSRLSEPSRAFAGCSEGIPSA